MSRDETAGAAPASRVPSSAEAPIIEVASASEARTPAAREVETATAGEDVPRRPVVDSWTPAAQDAKAVSHVAAAVIVPASPGPIPAADAPIRAADAPLVEVTPTAAIPAQGWTVSRLEPQDVLDPLPSPGRLQRLSKRLGLDERGNSVMTIIVIMAGLMAAGTAGVIFLEGADHLKETGSEVSEDAADSTLASMRLVEVYGESELGRVTVLHEVLTPGAGSPDIAFDGLVVSLAAGDTKAHYTYAGQPAEGNFTVRVIRDADGSTAGPVPYANKGDLIELVLPMPGDGLLPRQVVQQAIIMPGGNQVTANLEVPTAVTGELVQFRL